LSNRIRGGLLPLLSAAGDPRGPNRPRNDEAYSLFLRAAAISHDSAPNSEAITMLERAVALEPTPTILPDSLPAMIRGNTPHVPTATAQGLPAAGFDLEAHVKEIERGYIAEALKKAGGVQVKAAELLGMSFRSFRYYVKKYNLR